MEPQNNLEPIDSSLQEARIHQADEHQKSNEALLEGILVKTDETNPNPLLETMIVQNEDNTKKVVESLKEVASDMKQEMSIGTNAAMFLEGFLQAIKGDQGIQGLKGEKGDKGDKGDRGEKGDIGKPFLFEDFTEDQLFSLKIKGDPGKDGVNGLDGRDAIFDENDLIDRIVSSLPKQKSGKDGKNGKDGSPDSGEDIKTKLEALPKGKRLSYDNLDNLPNIDTFMGRFKGVSSKTYSFKELDDVPSTYSGAAGKVATVKSDESGLEFTTNGAGSVTTVSVVTANGVSGSVANPTSTPAITLTLGDITPDKITAAKALVENVATLTDGATPALDASLGNEFYLSAAGDRTIAIPTNAPAAGKVQKIIIRHFASGGARTLSLNTGAGGFRFGTDITALTQTASGKTDYIGAVWNSVDSFWDVTSYTKGF